MKSTILLPPYTLHQRLYLIRFFSGLTQIEMIRYLGIAQGWLSKMEQGQGEITAPILVALRQHFSISADAFLDGNIPYLKLARTFSNDQIFPRKYRGNERGRVRMLYGVVGHLEKTIGVKKTLQLFEELEIPQEILAEPRLRMNQQIFVDLVDAAVKKGLLPRTPWTAISQATLSAEALGKEYGELSGSDSPEVAFERFSKIAALFSDDLGYELRSKGERTVSLETVHPVDGRVSPEANAYVLKSLLQLKAALLKHVAKEFGNKVVTITQLPAQSGGAAQEQSGERGDSERLIHQVQW